VPSWLKEKEKTKMKRLMTICAVLLIVIAANANANTVDSSTMVFQGSLNYQTGGGYTGTIDMTAGNYYVSGGDGEGISVAGGFDLYAKEGGTAYVSCYSPTSVVISSDHDAYNETGAWGQWFDPDCEDWGAYSLQLTTDHWYLRYTSTGESPMSGTMNWLTGFAAETDLGTQDGLPDGTEGSAVHGGGGGAWDWDCGWGIEVIPLELPGFQVNVTPLGTNYFQVTLTPVPEPATICLLGLGALSLIRRKR
jgi:hypothetical protein